MTTEVSKRLFDSLEKISPLRHENHQDWFTRAEDYFAFEDLLIYLREDQPIASLDRTKDKKVLAILKALVDESMGKQLGQCSNAAAGWSHLKAYYENKIDRNDIYWLNKIENFQLQDEKNLLINFEQLTTMFKNLKKIETLEDYKLTKFCAKLNQGRYNSLINNHLLKATNEESFRNQLAHFDNQSNDRGQRRDEPPRMESSPISGNQRNQYDRRSNDYRDNNQPRSQPRVIDNRAENRSLSTEYSRSDCNDHRNQEHFRQNSNQPINRASDGYRTRNNSNCSRRNETNLEQSNSRKSGHSPRAPSTSNCSSTEGWNRQADKVRSSGDDVLEDILEEFKTGNRDGAKGRTSNREDAKDRARILQVDLFTEAKYREDAKGLARGREDGEGRTRCLAEDILDQFMADKREDAKGPARGREGAKDRKDGEARARCFEEDILQEYRNGSSRTSSQPAPKNPSSVPAVKPKPAAGSDWESDGDEAGGNQFSRPTVERKPTEFVNVFQHDDDEDEHDGGSPRKQHDQSGPKANDSPKKIHQKGQSSCNETDQERGSVCNGTMRVDDKKSQRSSNNCNSSVNYDDRYYGNQSDDWSD